MDTELVTVGTELLLGFTLDSNAVELARSLADAGVRVVRRTTVGDEPRHIERAVDDALARTGAVIVTGGLGPSHDDVTKAAVARLLGRPLELHAPTWAALQARYGSSGGSPTSERLRRQAEVPEGVEVLPNPVGTAPGLWSDGERGLIVLLPGVPHEARALTEVVVDRLRARASTDRVLRSRTLRTTGVPESVLAERLGELPEELAPVSLALLPGFAGVDLRLTVDAASSAEAGRRLAAAVRRLEPVLGDDCYGEDGTDLAAVVLELLRHRSRRLAVAESCTGGLVGARLTAIPGSSAVFQGGVIAYANAAKERDLGVSRELLERHGAVSEAVAAAMARGVAARFGTEVAVAVTGVAGPGGGTSEKPVGTVWLALRWEEAEVTRHYRYPGDRAEIRQRSAQAALDLVRRTALAPPDE